MRRWEYVAGKYAGIAALLALFTVALGAMLAGLLAWRGNQLGVLPAAWPVLLSACALQWMKFTLVAAMTLGSGRTHVMQGAVHLVMFAAFLFLAVAP